MGRVTKEHAGGAARLATRPPNARGTSTSSRILLRSGSRTSTLAGSGQLVDKNRFKVLDEFDEDLDGGDRDEEVFVGGVDGTKQSEWCHPSPTRTRMKSITFHVARVYRPLTSAAKIVQAGNRISLGPDAADNYIENVRTGERMQTHIEWGTCFIRRAVAERD